MRDGTVAAEDEGLEEQQLEGSRRRAPLGILRRRCTQRGLGPLLYGELLSRLEAEQRVHRAFAGIALPNDASVSLHEKCGYSRIGIFREIGYKFDRFWDVAWYGRDVSGRVS